MGVESSFVADREGTLRLGANDNLGASPAEAARNFRDNLNALSVCVGVTHTP